MLVGLSMCSKSQDNHECRARKPYLDCLSKSATAISQTTKCVFAKTEAKGDAVAVSAADPADSFRAAWGDDYPELRSIFQDPYGDAHISAVPTELFVRKDGGEDVHVNTLWGALKQELSANLTGAQKVYAEILKMDARMKWPFRAPYVLDMVTRTERNDGSRFDANMKDRVFKGMETDAKPAVIMLEEFQEPMANLQVLQIDTETGTEKKSFRDALTARGYDSMYFEDETLIAWHKESFVAPNFAVKELDEPDYTVPFQSEENTATGDHGAEACNLRFDEQLTVKAQLVSKAKSSAHQAAFLRLKHTDTNQMFVFVAVHLQTTTTDNTGEMRAYELQQMKKKLEAFVKEHDALAVVTGDFNLNFRGGEEEEEVKRRVREKKVFLGGPFSREKKGRIVTEEKDFENMLVKDPTAQTKQIVVDGKVDTGFVEHTYDGDSQGVALQLKDGESGSENGPLLLDMLGAVNQKQGCCTSKSSGRSEMIDFMFADERLVYSKHGGVCVLKEDGAMMEDPIIPDIYNDEPSELSDHMAVAVQFEVPVKQ